MQIEAEKGPKTCFYPATKGVLRAEKAPAGEPD